MKERPILFSGEMVRAIFDGKKTQTRRVIKPQPPEGRKPAWCGYSKTGWALEYPDGGCECTNSVRCPYGFPGDRLWVRETFCLEHQEDGNIPPHNDGRPIQYDYDPESCGYWVQPHYKATDQEPELAVEKNGEVVCGVKWTPCIHMPRWASRINLTVLDVRVERLQEISEEDAVAEGIDMPIPDAPHIPGMGATHPSAVFSDLWDKINAKRGYPWKSNPWVWVVEFERA